MRKGRIGCIKNERQISLELIARFLGKVNHKQNGKQNERN